MLMTEPFFKHPLTCSIISSVTPPIGSIMASGANPSMLELVDSVAIKAVNKTMDLGLKEVAASLIFEADGQVKEAVDYEINKMKQV